MARTPEKEGFRRGQPMAASIVSSAMIPPADEDCAPPPVTPRRHHSRPLTMIAPADALARVYAAAYLAARTKVDPVFSDFKARDEAVAAVRNFCALCTEEFDKTE